MKKIFSFFFVILLCSFLTSCSGGFSDLSDSDIAVKTDSSMELEYATQFEIAKVEGDIEETISALYGLKVGRLSEMYGGFMEAIHG